ncbi:MAG: hypothetical protein AB4058_18770 [Microcystaceae cyanobacterium]
MRQVLIIVNAQVKANGSLGSASPVTEKMVTALKRAIAKDNPETPVNVSSAADLWSSDLKNKLHDPNLVVCPLTIQLPHWLDCPTQRIYHDCKDIHARRRWVKESLAYPICDSESGLGDLWLPIMWTVKGPLYGEVIGEGAMPNAYQQPVDLPDRIRKTLYSLAYQLLDSLNAPPSVYLLQFRLASPDVLFDRLWPFPAAPAIASLRFQQPDLFACYWQCVTHQPLKEVSIIPPLTSSVPSSTMAKAPNRV